MKPAKNLCPKCGGDTLEKCPSCSADYWRCAKCKFVAPLKVFEEGILPSKKKEIDEKALKDGLLESGLNGP